MKVLVTGSDGFVGRNLRVALRRRPGVEVLGFDVASPAGDLERFAAEADFVFHLAGVNRPKDPAEFVAGNVDLTARLLGALAAAGRRAPVVFSSSTQAAQDNPYGVSKRRAEDLLLAHHRNTGAAVRVFRFPNVFGKWSNPNYNSVVSTFCNNLAHGLPVQVSNRDNEVTFVYIDEVVRCLLACMVPDLSGGGFGEVAETFRVRLGDLHDQLVAFRDARVRNEVPDLSSRWTRVLYTTYLSYLDPDQREVPVDLKTDPRGWLFELVKSPHAGQIFVSRTRPGITRGNHYHDSKIEKFCVIQGRGRIRMRRMLTDEVVSYDVSDDPIRVVDIPAGWTHSIENTGEGDMLTLFWSNEVFDPDRPDTYFEGV
ncbi:MAG: SDR family oxidoreductase [Lentisphaerae bacterium]|nr:SDR family oxidoreductase [Lentisphaerota bacterium]